MTVVWITIYKDEKVRNKLRGVLSDIYKMRKNAKPALSLTRLVLRVP